MGSGPSVPDDIRGHVAKYVPDRAPFLALRAASKFERDAVQRTIARRPGAVRRFGFYPRWADGETLARGARRAADGVRGVFVAIATLGKVFGKGVIHLSACGRAAPAVAALEFFVKQTNGGLQTLELYRANVAPDRLLELAARVRASQGAADAGTCAQITPYGIVEAIAQACPHRGDLRDEQRARRAAESRRDVGAPLPAPQSSIVPERLARVPADATGRHPRDGARHERDTDGRRRLPHHSRGHRSAGRHAVRRPPRAAWLLRGHQPDAARIRRPDLRDARC